MRPLHGELSFAVGERAALPGMEAHHFCTALAFLAARSNAFLAFSARM